MSTDNDRYLWDRSGDDPEVAQLEALLRPLAYRPRAMAAHGTPRRAEPRWKRPALRGLATAAVLGGLVLGGATYRFTWNDARPWDGYVITGGVDVRPLALAPGELLQTAAETSAVLEIARIGQMTVLPGSRVRMIETRTGQHRLALEVGAIQARVWAPPRFFGVMVGDTKVIDLGCEFDLRRTPDGHGELKVESGWVLLAAQRESLVPAGAVAKIHPTRGPGTPYRLEAHGQLKGLVDLIDARSGAVEPRGREIRSLIAASSREDAITFVSLLERYPRLAQGPLFEHTAALFPSVPVPDRGIVLMGGPGALEAWWNALPYPRAKRWWLHWQDAIA